VIGQGRWRGFLFLAGGVGCFLLASFLLWTFSGRFSEDGPTTEAGPSLGVRSQEAQVEQVAAPLKEEEWVVYVTGAVARPGVYSLPAGSRVYQLVEKSGGLTDEADAESINLAAKLADGVHVHVPREGEDKAPTQGFMTQENQKKGSFLGSASAGLIDINKASKEDLERLPGIGPKTAEAIIAYRESHGLFERVEDLLQVKGIGPKKLEAIRNLITVGSP